MKEAKIPQNNENKEEKFFDLSEINVYGNIGNSKEVLAYATEQYKVNPGLVIEFAFNAIDSHGNEDLGIEIISAIIKQKGWEDFFNEIMYAYSEENDSESSMKIINSLKECLHKLSTPIDLPTQKIEELLEKSRNDLEWVNLKSFIDLRKKVENLSILDGNELGRVASESEIPFWDMNKVREEAIKIISEDWEEYYGLLEDLYYGLNDMWGSEYGEPESPIVRENIDRWKKMSPRELLEDIYPVFSFNLLTKYKSREEMINGGFVLNEEDLRKEIKTAIKESRKVFYLSQFETEIKEKYKYLIGDQFNQYNLIPLLGNYAEGEGRTESEEKFGYALNSTILPIARDTFALYTPTGKFLTLFKEQKQENKFQNTERLMNMAHFMSHKNKLMETQYSVYDIALASCMSHWDIISDDIKEKLKKDFEHNGFNLDDLSKDWQYTSFEYMADVAKDYSHILYDNFPQDVVVYIQSELDARIKGLGKLHEIYPKDLLEDLYKEYGETKLDEERIVNLLKSLNFDSVKYLKETLNINLNQISKREFFALLTFLSESKNGNGFNKLKEYVGDADDPAAKANRIKTFLSLEFGSKEMGDKILFIGEELNDDPETADKLFAKYAKIVDGAEESSEEVCKMYDEIFYNKRLDKNEIYQTILKKAAKLLTEASDRLKEGSGEKNGEIIQGFIDKLSKETTSQKDALAEFKKIAVDMEKLFKEARRSAKGYAAEGMKEFDEWYNSLPDEEKKEMERMKELERTDKIDSKKLLSEIEAYRSYYMLSGQQEEIMREMGTNDKGIARLKKSLEEDRKNFEPVVQKLENILRNQTNLEIALENLIYGKESAELLKVIFEKYDELLKTSQNVKSEIKKLFTNDAKKEISDEEAAEISKGLLERADNLLTGYSGKMKNKTREDGAEVLKELDEIKTELLYFAEAFKTLKQEGGNIELTDFNKVKIERNSGAEITEDDKKEMIKIAGVNWAAYQFGGEVVEEFSASLKKSDNKFYIVKYENNIIGFIRFDQLGDCELYSGSLNVRKDLRGSSIGEAILKKMLSDEAQNNTIHAKAYSKLPITKRYIGEFGFVADDMIEKYHGLENEFGFMLIRDDKNNKKYKYFNKPIEEIKNDYKNNSYNQGDTQIILKYNEETELPGASGNIKSIISEGYVVTVYKKDGNDIYLVLERKAAEEIKRAA